ncbi:hypothetical protein BA062_05565 [Prauserella flavalba]|uniref:Uncharacterized protein n=1 Tax=Prauserella flavalba TaxID=1477506 RepID=A0A318LWL2_9PSEU|nr:hypothetical protein BA062_05565 [Prauserella flavalba]
MLAALAGLVLTPAGLWALTYGGSRQFARMAENSQSADGQGVALIAGGAVLLLAVALLGVVSAAAPLTGGLLWGVVPGLLGLVSPGTVYDALGALPRWLELGVGTLTWVSLGAVLAVGTLLTGGGLACGLVRRGFSPDDGEA